MMIGNVIKNRRQELKLTQEALAEKCNVTPQAVSRWENEISYPDTPLLPRICRALGLSADELLGIKEDADAAFCGGREDKALCQNDVDMICGFMPREKANIGKRVLIVDDVAFLRAVVSQNLPAYGFDVFEAEGGREALSMLQEESYDAVLLDINMPEMDGFEVLKKIREIRPEQRVVMLSALCGEANIRRALELGASGFVAKPFNIEALVERISLF